MKTYSEEKNNIIEKWGQPREYAETYKGSKYTEFIFTKISKILVYIIKQYGYIMT